MILISHRGNLYGPNKVDENKPEYVLNAIKKKFDVEVDIWFWKDSFYLGHDKPLYRIAKNFIVNKKFWFHAKNVEALQELITNKVHCFWHQTDDVVLTSKGYLWTFPGKKLEKKSICVLPELSKKNNFKICSGICSDFIVKYKNEKN